MKGVAVEGKPTVEQVPNNIDPFTAIPLGLKKVANGIKAATRLDPQLIFVVVSVRLDLCLCADVSDEISRFTRNSRRLR